MTRVLAVVPCLEDCSQTFASLRRQTIPPSKILKASGRFPGDLPGIRVSRAINAVLEGVDLSGYDYFLRVDSDTVLPPDWIERSVASGADAVGRGGYALLVRMGAFLAVGGRFRGNYEDSMLTLRLHSLGFRCVDYIVQPILLRKPGRGTDMRLGSYVTSGMALRRLGYEPLHAFASAVTSAGAKGNPRYLLGPAGYFFALLLRLAPFDPLLSRFVFRFQVEVLRKRARMFSSMRASSAQIRQ